MLTVSESLVEMRITVKVEQIFLVRILILLKFFKISTILLFRYSSLNRCLQFRNHSLKIVGQLC